MQAGTKQSAPLYKLVITHYLISAVFFAALTILLFFAADELLGHFFSPKILAITHVAALGWGSLVIFGACYQLLPVLFETDLFSYKIPWISLCFFVPGVILLVCSFWCFEVGLLMQIASILILISVLLFTLMVVFTARQNTKGSSVFQEFIITASFWLLGTALLGTLLVFNFQYAFLPKDHLHFLRLHAHMGIGGWFLLLIIGVSSKLIPMFLVSRTLKESYLNWSFYLINGALISFVTDTYFFGLNVKTYVIALVLLAGIACYLYYILVCFKSRLKLKFDLPIVNTLLSFVFLSSAIVLIPIIISYSMQGSVQSLRYSSLYGSLIFMGWISSLILGQAFKTFPFIVWARKFEHLTGKVKTPMPADLYQKGLFRIQTVTFAVFSVLFYSGMLLDSSRLIRFAIAFLAIAAIAYITNLLKVLFYKID